MQSHDSSSSSEQNPQFSIKPLLLTLLILGFLAVFVKFQYSTTISPINADAPADVFSSERAFNFLQHLTQEQVPHPVDSPANRIVERRIVSALQKMGYQPEIQESPICQDSSRGYARCTNVRNIIVHIQGSDKGILLAAHYDSVPAGPGGSDAGAAVGTLLETARLLSLTKQPLNTIVLLFNEGEELGLFGARVFMEQHPLAKQLKLAINVEARGSSGKSVMFETGEDSGWLVSLYGNSTPAPLSSSLFYEVYKFLPNDTDLTVFKQHGLQGLNFAHADRLAHYHTPLDNLKNLDRGSLQHHGDNVWGVVKQIKDLNLSQVNLGNIVYSDILGLVIVQWSENGSLVASIFSLVIFVFLSFFFRKLPQLNLIQQIKSFFGLILILVTSAASGFIVLQTVQYFSGHGSPWHTNPIPMQLSVWFSVLLLGLILGKQLVKKLIAINILSSTVLLLALLSLMSSIWLTGVSFLFLIPTVVGLAGLAVLAQLSKVAASTKQVASSVSSSIFISNVVVTAIMFMPIAYILELMVGFGMSLAIGLMLGFVMVGLLPLLSIKAESTFYFKQLVLGIGVLILGMLIWTSVQPPYSAWMPQRLNVNYVQNEQNEAFITSGYSNNKLSKSQVDFLPESTTDLPVLPWSRASFHATKVASQQQFTSEIMVKNKQLVKSEMQISARISTPQVNVENAHLSDVKVFVPIELGLTSIKVGDESIQYQNDESNRNGFYEYHCRGVSCKSIEITMNFISLPTDDNDRDRSIIIMAAYPGIPKEFATFLRARGDTSVPSQSGDQSLIYAKFKL
jgi:hypothetical protein